MTFFQLIKEIFDNSRERIKTPITGAFFTALILYNWRPILQLIFSKMAMEHRIDIVDHDYIDYRSWLVPLVLAVGYITVVPLFTNLIDGLMVKNKKSRTDKIYDSKDYDLDKRIEIASKERQLKNVETYNKEIEDYTAQIQQLEVEKEQMKNEHEIKNREFNSKMDDLLNINISSADKVEKLNAEVKKLLLDEDIMLKILAQIGIGGINALRAVEKGKNENIMQMDPQRTALYKKLGLIEQLTPYKILLTELGESVMNKFTAIPVEHFQMTDSEKLK